MPSFPIAPDESTGDVALRNEATRRALRDGCYRWADEA